MNAAWYEEQGPAREVLIVGELPDPEPGADEVRIRVVASGLNPGDVKKCQDVFGVGMPYPLAPIVGAHEAVEAGKVDGRVVVSITD